jgi:2-oxoglutarate dehydrogenase E2 component (dihydrolipoamide succinyltransferase)
MKTPIKIPAVGESITEATIAQWVKKDGEAVKRDEIILILETDKASVEVVAENAGRLSVKTKEGQTVPIGSIVGEIDGDGAAAPAEKPSAAAKPSTPPPPVSAKPAAPPVAAVSPSAPPPVAAKPAAAAQPLSPAVRRVVEEQGLNVAGLSGTGKDGRLTKGDLVGSNGAGLQTVSPNPPAAKPTATPAKPTSLPQPKAHAGAQSTTREPMTKLRQTIARRLVEAQHNAAILTTFNEVDMSNVIALRAKYKDKFKEKYGINLGFMGFFVKAAIEALKGFPRVNAFIEGTDILYNHFYNVGIAVGTEKGLIVPAIKNADMLTIAEVEQSIKHYAEKARDGKISLEDLSGGTFTISNGGVYGSLMSTPILNPPQSAILGLHKIEERPVAIQGKVEVRPMMYVALSYDHRVIDGAESVSFLVKIKEGIEDPTRLLIEV